MILGKGGQFSGKISERALNGAGTAWDTFGLFGRRRFLCRVGRSRRLISEEAADYDCAQDSGDSGHNQKNDKGKIHVCQNAQWEQVSL